MPQKNKTVYFQDLGLLPFQEAWNYQRKVHQGIVELKLANRKRAEEEQEMTDNYLLFCEHPHVYTLGKSGDIAHLLLSQGGLKDKDIEFFKINRGGDITYHGPGQVMGYPILDLDNFFTDLHKYFRFLEEVMIRTLADYDLKAGRIAGSTGVWLDEDQPLKARKICAFGAHCSRWVTMHGWSINVNADLSYFDYIVPCGIRDKGVTSLHRELGVDRVDESVFKARLKRHFEAVFECVLVDKVVDTV